MQSAVPARPGSPRAISAVGVFLVFGSCMATLAGTTLVWPDTALDKFWALNEPAHKQLAPIGSAIAPLFLLLSATLVTAAVGWFKRRLWGWRLAVGVIAVQVAGDLLNFLRGDFLRGGTGFAIAGALMFYLLRPRVRASFH